MLDVIVLNEYNQANVASELIAEDFFGSYIEFCSDHSQYKITKVERDDLGTKLYCGNFVFLYNKHSGEIFQLK